MRDSVPEDILGAGHVGTVCLAGTKILDSQKESMCSGV